VDPSSVKPLAEAPPKLDEPPKPTPVVTSKPDGPNRKERKTQQWIDSVRQSQKEPAQPTGPVEYPKIDDSLPDEAPKEESEEEEQAPQIQGLSNEFLLKTLKGKALQRLKRKIQAEEEKERAERERLKKIFEEREIERLRREQEEEDKRR
jgi:hypothetical protein